MSVFPKYLAAKPRQSSPNLLLRRFWTLVGAPRRQVQPPLAMAPETRPIERKCGPLSSTRWLASYKLAEPAGGPFRVALNRQAPIAVQPLGFHRAKGCL